MMRVGAARAVLRGRSRGLWRWLLRNWPAVLLPPAMFLLAAGVTHQAYRAWDGSKTVRWRDHMNAGMRATEKGDLTAAVAEIEAAERLAPEDPEIHRELAAALHKAGREARALDHMEKSMRLKPKDLPIANEGYLWLGLAESNYIQGRSDVAERLIRADVLPRWPNIPEAHVYLGRIELTRDAGEAATRKALASFDAALRLSPDHMDAHKSRGDALARLGRLAEAEREYRAALKVNPYHRSAAKELAAVLRRQGQNGEAREVLARLETINEMQSRARHIETKINLQTFSLKELLELGELYLTLDRNAEAEQALLRYTRQEPTDPRGHRKLAEAARRLKKARNAELSDRLAQALEAKGGGRP